MLRQGHVQGAVELSGKTWNQTGGRGRFLIKVIGRISELGVGTLEMSSCILVIPTWTSRKSFKLKLFKMELVTKKMKALDFPGGPVVKTPSSQCRGHGFDPWSGKIPHATWSSQKK